MMLIHFPAFLLIFYFISPLSLFLSLICTPISNFPAVGVSCFIHGESGRTGVGLRYSGNDPWRDTLSTEDSAHFNQSRTIWPISGFFAYGPPGP